MTRPPCCPQEVHEAIKTDLDRWYRETMSLYAAGSVQIVDTYPDGREEVLELRNCRTCCSTISRLVSVDKGG